MFNCGKIVFSNNIEQFVFNCGKIVFSNNIEKFVFNCGKIVFRYISRCARCERCSKLKIKTPEFVKMTIKVTIKTPLTWFWSLYCWLWTHSICCYSVFVVDVDQVIAGCGCWMLFWRFVPAGIRRSFYLWRKYIKTRKYWFFVT